MYENKFHTVDLSKKSFLVTGGAGFIGSNLVEYLLKYGAGKVVVLDNLATGFKENIQQWIAPSTSQWSGREIEFTEGDICDFDTCIKACKGIDFLFHEAALGSVPRSIQNPVATNNVNVSGFVNILTAAKEAKVKRVVYASSSSVYGDSATLPKVENEIGSPLSPYAVSKLTNEFYANIFCKTYGMEIIGLRYFNVFGPRQNPKGEYAAAIPLFIDALVKNKSPLINGDGEQTRDFTFVENAVDANIKAMFTENEKTIGEVFNVAVAERVSINDLIHLLKKITGSSANATHKEQRMGDVRDSLADISKAKKYFNYHPKIKIEDGLKITLEWFRK